MISYLRKTQFGICQSHESIKSVIPVIVSPWFHENSSKVDLCFHINAQNILQQVLRLKDQSMKLSAGLFVWRTTEKELQATFQIRAGRRALKSWVLHSIHYHLVTFSPMDTPPEVTMTSTLFMAFWSSCSNSSALKGWKCTLQSNNGTNDSLLSTELCWLEITPHTQSLTRACFQLIHMQVGQFT